jgi:hypothetical protein
MTAVDVPKFDVSLLEAMLAMVKRKGVDAVAVPAYRERSYNIGYCVTCSEYVTEVRIYYVHRSGSPGHWDFSGDLGELIRALTEEPEVRAKWVETAIRGEDDDDV